MIRYDIAALAKRRKGTVQQLPAIHGSIGAEVAYLRALRAMLREMANTSSHIDAGRAMPQAVATAWHSATTSRIAAGMPSPRTSSP